MDENIRRDIILEHYQNPKNKEEVHDSRYVKVNANNASCIDTIDLYVLLDEGIIKDIKFQGEACAISTSSTSIMITQLIGKTKEEAKEYIANFEAMVSEEPYIEEALGEGNVYNTIYKQNNRKTCALLPLLAMKKALEEQKTK